MANGCNFKDNDATKSHLEHPCASANSFHWRAQDPDIPGNNQPIGCNHVLCLISLSGTIEAAFTRIGVNASGHTNGNGDWAMTLHSTNGLT